MAGPGGKIVKQVFTSTGGRIVLIILTVIFLPLIIYQQSKEYIAVRRTRKSLQAMAMRSPHFDAISLNNQITNVFTRVHLAWGKEDLTECKDFMSSWYLLNQQMVNLDQWAEKGLENVSQVKRINDISPIHLRISPDKSFDGSRIVVKINANVEDYLRLRDTKKIVAGKPGFTDVSSVWTLLLDEGKWKVDNIEEVASIAKYAAMENLVETGVPSHQRG
jgi:hypothetical protein